MKHSIDDTLSRIARRTHSPRGQYAATPQNYQTLLDRIPAGQRPIIGHSSMLPAHEPSEQPQHTAFPRWSAAACLLLVVGIGLAIAGVWYQYHHTSSEGDGLPVPEHPGMTAGSRTLIYEQAPLADIAAELSDIFHTPIQIARPDLRDYRITATFSTDEPLDEILSILAEIANFQIRETQEGIVIE